MSDWGLVGTPEEVAAADRARAGARLTDRDGRICVCGHPVARHYTVVGITSCKPTRMECPCEVVTPVLETSDVRVFIRKTLGSGNGHSLSRGLSAVIAKSDRKQWAWLTGWPRCMRCEGLERTPEEGALTAASISARGVISKEPERINALLCGRCVKELTKSEEADEE